MRRRSFREAKFGQITWKRNKLWSIVEANVHSGAITAIGACQMVNFTWLVMELYWVAWLDILDAMCDLENRGIRSKDGPAVLVQRGGEQGAERAARADQDEIDVGLGSYPTSREEY
ncbi:hypothetical protein B0H16DRAFT_1463478 [Mycena metata]|uniref:Uncharacterized protein n=1 Tax=Mycena metata TaxID=1033252 RepID=A0AAD7IJT5_9AGAR|nr:hypothetical protein B0H16DRAFT_1463478 [Mycena metata]